MNLLRHSIESESFFLDLGGEDLVSVVHHLFDRAVASGLVPEDCRAEVEEAILARDRAGPTAIGHGIAVPHAYLESIPEPTIIFARLSRPLNLGAPDGVPTRFIFMLLGPPSAPAQHLDTLAAIARLMSDSEFRYEAAQARNKQTLLEALDHFTARTQPAAEGVAIPAPTGLEASGRLAGGFIDDIRRRLPHYRSDFTDGLHPKTLGSILFLLFACLAPAITFGGVMAVQTEGSIGAVEMIAASALCGVVYALIGGQPLIILGGTGPLLVFTAILYRLCDDFGIPFLPTYAWVGFWTALMTVALALTDASCLMRYFTRFTDEIFAALISIIFVYEAVKALVHIFHDLDVKKHHDTALLSLLLALGTFYVANSLAGFRRSRYLLPQVREFLADFGPAIALAAMTIAAALMHEVYLDVLPAPDRFGTTNGRPWLVNPLEAPMWVWGASLVPAALVTVLVYLDQNITARIINSPDHRLQKGPAYHLDLGIVGVLIGVCSAIGLPWLVAATVRSLNHVRSLATIEEMVLPGGDRRDQIIHVRETRITGIAIHALVGVSLIALPLLKVIPMAVLYGLFLFMGFVSMKGNQFFERLNLWPMDRTLYPSTHYIRNVSIGTIHKYTLLQLSCLVVLWIVKASRLGILFPLFIALIVPIRMLAARYFSERDLEVLDAEEEPEGESDRRTE